MYWDIALLESDKYKKVNDSLEICSDRRHLTGFTDEFHSTNDIKLIANRRTDIIMQALWINERILKDNCFDDESTSRILAPVKVIKLHFNISGQNNLPFVEYNKICTINKYLLSLQLSYLQPCHENIIKSLCYSLCHLFLVEKSVDNKEKSEMLIDNLLLLLKIGIYELYRRAKLNDRSLDFNYEKVSKFLSQLDYDDIFNCLQHTSNYNPDESDINFTSNYNFESMVRICNFIVYKICFTLTSKQYDNNISIETMNRIKFLIYFYVSCNFRAYDLDILSNAMYYTSLHSILNTSEESEEIHEINVMKKYVLPVSIETIKILLECGANVNPSIDVSYMTPIIAAVSSSDIETKNQCDSIILLLIKKGAHIDYTNKYGKTIFDIYEARFNENISNIYNVIHSTTLQCLAARVIRQNDIEYNDNKKLSKFLIEFVRYH
jgi:hypothetical protein